MNLNGNNLYKWMTIPEAIDNQTNIPLVDMTYLPVSCWPGRYRDLKQHKV